ncbi:MAG: hypothetical protein LQ345_005618 [Seirophora villosa]|nr:MAG: hypothetical protein LQ345_005618 [Seirophora villosa]
MADLLQAIPQLATVPQCAHPAYQALSAAGCGPDLKCICANVKLFATLQSVFAVSPCSPSEAKDAMVNIREICSAAVPWLNHNRGNEVVGAVVALTVLATTAVVLRFLARHMTRTSYGLDDWLMLFALIWLYGLSSVFLYGVHSGLGRHTLMLDLDQVINFGKAFFVTTCVFPVACAALKFSILIFYHRIFPFRKFTISCIGIGFVVIAWFIAFIVASFLSCRPLAYYWDKSIAGGHCINLVHVSFYITSPPDILTNFAILALPLPWLWNLQMQLQRKVVVICIFILGSFAAFGSVVRIPLMHRLEIDDATYSSVSASLWLDVEIAIGIVSGSLPLMRPLFTHPSTSRILSRFSRSRVSTDSERLPDGQQPSDRVSSSRSKWLHSSGVYAGGGKQQQQQGQKSWWDQSLSTKAFGSRLEGAEAERRSVKDMVPMGRIQVRHDLEWGEQGRPVTR